jgi:transposase
MEEAIGVLRIDSKESRNCLCTTASSRRAQTRYITSLRSRCALTCKLALKQREATPAGHWRTLTVLGAMSAEGLIATMTIEAPTDREIFLGYLEEALCPRLKPGQIVVMDNLSSHKVVGVSELIHAAGAELLYLPPYSPDFNPIEKYWSKFKQKLRSFKARTLDALEIAVAAAIPHISPQNAQAWFKHCGYGL